MPSFRFEWDEAKNEANRRKRRVSFEDAAQVFLDPLHRSVRDRFEGGEERWQTIGLSAGYALLIAAHTVAEEGADGKIVDIIRIVSARRATRRERHCYEGQTG